MRTFLRALINFIVTSLLVGSAFSQSASAQTYTDAPAIDFHLPVQNQPPRSYGRDGLAVLPDGSYWTCTEENGLAGAVKWARNSQGNSNSIRGIIGGGNPCQFLSADSQGRLVYAEAQLVSIYAADAEGFASPIRQIQIVSENNIQAMALDSANNIYLFMGDRNIWVFNAGANGQFELPDRVIDGSYLGGDDIYIAATPDGTVFAADYADENIKVFSPNNNGPNFDREIVPNVDAASFGGITLNGSSVYVTLQDGAAPGVYEFSTSSSGSTTPLNSWAGPNVVTSGNDALFAVGVSGCSGQLISIEGYNNRILTWNLDDTHCPAGSGSVLANTGLNATTTLFWGATLVSAGILVSWSARRRSRNGKRHSI